MKAIAIAILSFLIISGCRKTIEKKAENAIVQAMTDGQWVVTSFTINGSDTTSSFTGYKFQYFSNNTVEAIRNGSVEKTGSWQGDITTMSISANFTNAVNPLLLINGTWHITDSGWTYVIATMTVGSEVRALRLDKQ